MKSKKTAENIPPHEIVHNSAEAVVGQSQAEDRIEITSQAGVPQPTSSEGHESSTASGQIGDPAKAGKKSPPAEKVAKPKKEGTAVPPKPSHSSPAEGSDGIENTPSPSIGQNPSELEGVKKSASGIDQMPITSVEKEIYKACKQGDKHSVLALKSTTLHVTYGWVTGKLLNRAKALLRKKGEFGKWRDKHLVDRGLMSVKTAQRYMALADKWSGIDELLIAAPNLWKAYQDAGVLPTPDTDTTDEKEDSDADESSENKANEAGDAEVDLVEEFATKCRNLQKELRHLKELKAQLHLPIPKDTKVQIDLMADEIIQFVTSLREATA